MTTIIRGGCLVTAAETIEADILIEEGRIALIGRDLPIAPGCEVVEAAGRLVLPGGVDAHVHLDLPMFGTVSADDHYTGMKAAAFGGTTTVIDFIPQDAEPLKANIDAWHDRADGKAAVDFGFHMNITRLDARVEEQIPALVDEGITSIKVFTAYNNRLRLPDGDIFRVLRLAGKAGLLTLLHAENGDVIDLLVAEALASGRKTPEWHAHTRLAWGAVESALRGFAMAAETGAPLYLVHMNTAGEVDMLQYARGKGVHVMGETCPQYLFFTADDLRKPDGSKWICSPPVRSVADNARLWQGLEEGIIQVAATDHCPFFYNGTKPILYEGKSIAIPGKELGEGDFTKIPNGLPGVGDRMPILWTEGVVRGRLTPNQFVAINCSNPARIFGLYPQKGSLMPGADADIAIWDPQREVDYGVKASHHRTDYNLYEGWKLKGFPEKVFLRGRLIVDGERWLGRAGMGQYVKRRPFGEVI